MIAATTPELVIVQKSGLTVRVRVENLVAPIIKAQLVIKADLAAPDDTAIITKIVTTAAGADGVVADPGVQGGEGVIEFTIGPDDADNAALTMAYYSSVKVWPSSGDPYTPKKSRRGVRVIAAGVDAIT